MKKNILKSLIKDQGFVLLNDWQENNLKNKAGMGVCHN